jgi:hypothetical protein
MDFALVIDAVSVVSGGRIRFNGDPRIGIPWQGGRSAGRVTIGKNRLAWKEQSTATA